jgi:hypothetical protein
MRELGKLKGRGFSFVASGKVVLLTVMSIKGGKVTCSWRAQVSAATYVMGPRIRSRDMWRSSCGGDFWIFAFLFPPGWGNCIRSACSPRLCPIALVSVCFCLFRGLKLCCLRHVMCLGVQILEGQSFKRIMEGFGKCRSSSVPAKC